MSLPLKLHSPIILPRKLNLSHENSARLAGYILHAARPDPLRQVSYPDSAELAEPVNIGKRRQSGRWAFWGHCLAEGLGFDETPLVRTVDLAKALGIGAAQGSTSRLFPQLVGGKDQGTRGGCTV